MSKLTYTATLPNGHTVTRSSATMAYTHLCAVRDSGGWGVISFHKTEAAAYKNIGHRRIAANFLESRVIAVTGFPFSSPEAKAARAAEKAGTVAETEAVEAPESPALAQERERLAQRAEEFHAACVATDPPAERVIVAADGGGSAFCDGCNASLDFSVCVTYSDGTHASLCTTCVLATPVELAEPVYDPIANPGAKLWTPKAEAPAIDFDAVRAEIPAEDLKKAATAKPIKIVDEWISDTLF
jgi:hypothetical protein